MVLGFLSTLVLGQGVLGTVVAGGTLLIFVLPAVMTVVIETTALRCGSCRGRWRTSCRRLRTRRLR